MIVHWPWNDNYLYAGKEPWVNLLALINEKSTADLDIKAKAMSLINRVG